MTIELNDDNFMVFAIKHYSNPGCVGMSELEDDLKRFKYLKRLFNRYANTGEPNERLIINHLVPPKNLLGVRYVEDLFSDVDYGFLLARDNDKIIISKNSDEVVIN